MESTRDVVPTSQEVLRLAGITISLNSIEVLHDVDLSVSRGEVHAIVGEHGSGKSLLAKVMSGVLTPDSGELFFDGSCVNTFSRALFLKLGIDAVLNLPPIHPAYSVAENLLVPGARNRRELFFHSRNCVELAREYLRRYDFDLDPTIKVNRLSLSKQTLIAVLRALYNPPRLIILDETLERLLGLDREKVIAMLAQFKKAGMAIVLITHAMGEIYSLADNVSIIREGRILLTESIPEIDKISLLQLAYTGMLGEGTPVRFNKDFYHMLMYNEVILEKLPSPVLVVDNAGKVIMLNDHAKSWFKHQLEPYPGVPLSDLFDRSETEISDFLYRAMEKKAEAHNRNLRFDHQKTRTNADVTLFPIFDGAQVLGYIIILQDITEREKLREQVALSEQLASVGLLAAGVAHEINNPLATVANLLEGLKYVRSKDPALNEIRQDLQDQFNYIGNIVDNLVSFSSVRDTSTEEDIDIADVLHKMIRLIKTDAERRKISINLDQGTVPLIVRVNQNQIRQVMLNLFRNSFEAMPEGGNIAITVSPFKTERGMIVRIIFADTGCGLSCEDPNDIFLPFYSSKKTWGKNLGLGLSISYNIIKNHGGQISARSRQGCGCEFEVSLPYAGTS